MDYLERVKFNEETFCWEWLDGKRDGYGQSNLNGKNILIHRYSYEFFRGKIPDGMTIDHLCRNRACCNPEHLEVVTRKENVLRGIGITAKNSQKTHCKRGHPLSGDNLYMTTINGRCCRECRYMKQKLWYGKS